MYAIHLGKLAKPHFSNCNQISEYFLADIRRKKIRRPTPHLLREKAEVVGLPGSAKYRQLGYFLKLLAAKTWAPRRLRGAVWATS